MITNKNQFFSVCQSLNGFVHRNQDASLDGSKEPSSIAKNPNKINRCVSTNLSYLYGIRNIRNIVVLGGYYLLPIKGYIFSIVGGLNHK